jgi:sarcosine oxidase gamma subunit
MRLEILSHRARFGCKGPGAEAWLTQEGYRVPGEPNSAQLDGDGVLIARLATSEFLIEAVDGGGERVKSTRQRLESSERPPDVYPVPRQDLVVGIHGADIPALLQEMCSVDFSSLLDSVGSQAGPVVLTSMIGVGVVAWPRRAQGKGALTLWVDRTFGHYFLTTLFEVAEEYGGAAVHEPTVAGESI